MKRPLSAIAVALAASSCALFPAGEKTVVSTERTDVEVSLIADDLRRPWSLAFLPGEEGWLVTERGGTLLRIAGEDRTVIGGLPDIASTGQGGLLDVVLSPDFLHDRLVYLSFAEAGTGGYGTAVVRGRLPAGANRLEAAEVIYRALPKSGGGRHFGSRLLFDRDGYLYVTLGERGSMDRAQDVEDPYGSVLRLYTDGSIPADNPFVGGPGADEIWAYGSRNAQGMALHPDTGDVWTHEHGPKGGDEVNIVAKGANYGWPLVTHGIDYNGSIISDKKTAPGITDPIVVWVPSIAPSGMAFADGAAFPEWKGNLFVGALAGQHLRRLELDGDTVVHQEVLLKNRVGRIRDVRNGPDGNLYLLTDADDGGLYRLSPAD